MFFLKMVPLVNSFPITISKEIEPLKDEQSASSVSKTKNSKGL
jgi:hypothetical protein